MTSLKQEVDKLKKGKIMNIRRKIFTATLGLMCFALGAFGQPNAKKKQYTLSGKVEAVDTAGRKLSVNHGNVQGWMDAMTMAYPVDKPEVLKTIKVGNQIRATVYDGDMKLYNVKVVPPGKKQK